MARGVSGVGLLEVFRDVTAFKVSALFCRANEIPGVGWRGSLTHSQGPGLLDTLVTLHS